MKNNRLQWLLVMAAMLIGAPFGFAQVTGTGTKNTVPLWTSSTTQGNSSITENPLNKSVSIGGNTTVHGVLNAQQYEGPLGVLLHHASFQGASQSSTGSHSVTTVGDGVAIVTAGIDLGSTMNVQSNTADTTSCLSPIKSGSFLSLRLKAFSTPVTSDAVAYFLAGGDVEGVPARNGFGFKYVGGSDLHGVSIRNGTESLVDLGTNLGTLTTDPPADLFAILRSTGVQFFVNGVLKGTITTNLPSSSDTVYEIYLNNGSSAMQSNSWVVSYMTVGFPTVGAPQAGTF